MSASFEMLSRDGFEILRGTFAPAAMMKASEAIAHLLDNNESSEALVAAKGGPAAGLRNLLGIWPDVVDLVRQSPLCKAVEEILGPHAGIVRGLYFDKPPGHSWALPWHRDLTIAVKRHGALGQFNRPTLKAGVPHVEAPRELLAQMLTARIHLDAMSDANGPLRVLTGSHLRETPNCEAIAIHCEAGDVFLMRPLLAHASALGQSNHPGHRRVIHLEFAPSPELPDGYEWHDFVALR